MAKGIIKIFIGGIIFFIIVAMHIEFIQNCAGYLKQAADANTTEIALSHIELALEYIECHGLTHGYTSVIWRTEDENIGFWYENIKACREELREAAGKSQLEQTNVLMKVRESLTDTGDGGTVLTVPDGISRYPHNAIFGVLMIFGALMLVLGYTDIRAKL